MSSRPAMLSVLLYHLLGAGGSECDNPFPLLPYDNQYAAAAD